MRVLQFVFCWLENEVVVLVFNVVVVHPSPARCGSGKLYRTSILRSIQ